VSTYYASVGSVHLELRNPVSIKEYPHVRQNIVSSCQSARVRQRHRRRRHQWHFVR